MFRSKDVKRTKVQLQLRRTFNFQSQSHYQLIFRSLLKSRSFYSVISMEDPTLVQSAAPNPPPNPPISGQPLPSQTQTQISSTLPPNSKKRHLDNDSHLQNSSHFKLRAVLRDLRPHFVEVLRTPDFRNCKAAEEIREQLKLVVELFKKTKTESLPLSGHDKVDQKVQEKPRNVMSTVQPQQNNMYSKPSENRYQPSMGCDKVQGEDKQNSGTYVVGGSAFGWNFITFPGKESVYYGVTKESFRAANK